MHEDIALRPLRRYYHATALLWRGLHVHRDGGTVAAIVGHIVKALEVIAGTLAPPSRSATKQAERVRKGTKAPVKTSKPTAGAARANKARMNAPALMPTTVTKARVGKLAPAPPKTPAPPRSPDDSAYTSFIVIFRL